MILHVDMDAFYASVEERDAPELAGQPIIVGGAAESRGVVSTANYVARQFGVHSAMPSTTAKRLCPHGVFLAPRMEHYARISAQIREIFARFTPLIEPLSLDEAFLDVGQSLRLFGSPRAIAEQIQQAIRVELRLSASVGIAPIKFAAKIASDLEKPGGLVEVLPEHLQAFLDPLPIERIWGIGKQSLPRFHNRGLRTIYDVRNYPHGILEQEFGKWGLHVWQLAQGIDPRKVTPDQQAKQISHETTFAHDVQDPRQLRAVLMELVEQVGRRLRRHDLQARTMQLKLRLSDFQTSTRSATLTEPTFATRTLWNTAQELLLGRLKELQRTHASPAIRLLGFAASGLCRPREVQGMLFDQQQRQRDADVDAAADEIRRRFGNGALKRGAAFESHDSTTPEPNRRSPSG